MKTHLSGRLPAIFGTLSGWLGMSLPEPKAAREERELRIAVSTLLAEIARVGSSSDSQTWTAAARAVADLCRTDVDEAQALIGAARQPALRPTSYFPSVSVLNSRLSPEQKVRFMEHVWRVACADGEIGLYQDRLARKFANLLYVAHADIVLSRHRIRAAMKVRTG